MSDSDNLVVAKWWND